jgi:ubiquinone/menaquinone biosynthesis C-methylase UbiE
MTELKSNAEWKQWGKHDPLWGAASWANKQKGGTSPWTEEGFYRLGESDWQSFLAHWRQYGLSTRSCLEIGCGAGRITRQLAKSFNHVYAVDVSEDMISCAREAVDCENVEYSVIDGVHLPQPACAVTAIFSTHVLQHLDSTDIGFSYFREFFRVLDTGGTIMVHLPLHRFPGDASALHVLMECLYAVSRRLGNIRSDIKRHWGAKTMRGTSYPIQSLHRSLVDLGFQNVEFRLYPLPSNGDLHSFVFATK